VEYLNPQPHIGQFSFCIGRDFAAFIFSSPPIDIYVARCHILRQDVIYKEMNEYEDWLKGAWHATYHSVLK